MTRFNRPQLHLIYFACVAALVALAFAASGCGKVTLDPCPKDVTLGCMNFDPPADGSQSAETGPQATEHDAGRTTGQAGAGGAPGSAGSPSGEAGGTVVPSDGGAAGVDGGVSDLGGSGAGTDGGSAAPQLPVCQSPSGLVNAAAHCATATWCFTGCVTDYDPSVPVKAPCIAFTQFNGPHGETTMGTCVQDCSQCP